ncbi:ABC transporter substrate-binding protein [Candidatus Wolfebacteria bacterium]|nr:ABC transporter substrate-binding protein [Candidatus Wolfebacteria bacterium]
MKNVKCKLSILFIAIVLLAGFGLVSWNKSYKSEEEKIVKIGYLAIAGALPLFIANDQGYFKEGGITVELVQFNTSNEIAIAAALGKIDVIGIGATNAVLDASVTSGKKFEAFATIGYVKATKDRKSTDALIMRNGQSIFDIKGKKVAFFPGSVSRVFAEIVFPQNGIAIDEIEYIELPPSAWKTSLDTGVIDAVHVVEPFIQILLADPNNTVLIDGYLAEVMPDVPLSAVWIVDGQLSKKQERKIVIAYKKAINFVSEDRDTALKSFESFTKMPAVLYSEIGLNKWSMMDNLDSQKSLKSFVELLDTRGAIKDIPKSYIWID